MHLSNFFFWVMVATGEIGEPRPPCPQPHHPALTGGSEGKPRKYGKRNQAGREQASREHKRKDIEWSPECTFFKKLEHCLIPHSNFAPILLTVYICVLRTHCFLSKIGWCKLDKGNSEVIQVYYPCDINR